MATSSNATREPPATDGVTCRPRQERRPGQVAGPCAVPAFPLGKRMCRSAGGDHHVGHGVAVGAVAVVTEAGLSPVARPTKLLDGSVPLSSDGAYAAGDGPS